MTTATTTASDAHVSGPEKTEACYGAIVFAVGLVARLWLIYSFPIIFGGDSVVRLANKDRIFLSYQLPLLQAAIYVLSSISDGPLVIRYFMAVAGAAAGLAFYAMAASLLGRTAAFQTALLFVASPFVLAFSIVPYQEILMLAGLLAAFYFAFESRWPAASLALGLACLTRYEAWLACPLIAIAFLRDKGWRRVEFVKAALLFGWAPLGWIALHAGLTPRGTFAIDTTFSVERFYRYLYLGWITVKNTPVPVLVLAAVGLWVFWKQELWRSWRYQLLMGFLGLFLIALLLSAHGERDQPERFVTAREAYILLAATILLAGVGLVRVRRYRWPLVVLSAAVGFWMAYGFVARETSAPAFALSYQAARYLEGHVGNEEQVIVLAQAIPRDMLARYLDKAERAGGSRGRRQAVDVLLDLEASPPNYQRVLVNSHFGRRQLRSVSSLPADLVPRAGTGEELSSQPDWLVVWSDFIPTNQTEQALQDEVRGREAEKVFALDDLHVGIYRLR